MANVRPMKIPGRWRDGVVLDFHTVSSTYLGDDEYGHPQFDTKRTELGELLYRLKYRSDMSFVAEIVDTIATFIEETWKPSFDLIVPVPPSRARGRQPVRVLAEGLGERLSIPVESGCIKKVADIPELKNIYDYDERLRLLEKSHSIDSSRVEGRRVLLFDDLYRSGATMNAITLALYDQGAAAEVFGLAVTRTRGRL